LIALAIVLGNEHAELECWLRVSPRTHNLESTPATTGPLDIVRLPGIVPGTANIRSDRASGARAPENPNPTPSPKNPCQGYQGPERNEPRVQLPPQRNIQVNRVRKEKEIGPDKESRRTESTVSEEDPAALPNPEPKDKQRGKRKEEEEEERDNVQTLSDDNPATPFPPKRAKEGKEAQGSGKLYDTGHYKNLAEAKGLANEEMRRALELVNEEKWMKLAPEEVIRKSDINPEEITARAVEDPTADLTNRIKESQIQVLRVVKASRNLKGTCQRDLKLATANTLGILEVLRTRTDRTAEQANTEEIKLLKRSLEETKSSMAREMTTIREQMEKALIRAEAESVKAQEHLNLYKKTLQEREELRARLQRQKEDKTRRMDHYENWSYTEEKEEKGIDVDPPEMNPGTGKTTLPLKPAKRGEPKTISLKKRVEATEQELRDPPAIRPPLKGVLKIIEDRPPTASEREKIKELLAANTTTTKKRKENKRGPNAPNWNKMEPYSGEEEEETHEQALYAPLESPGPPKTVSGGEDSGESPGISSGREK